VKTLKRLLNALISLSGEGLC
jgi:hypothetical protein